MQVAGVLLALDLLFLPWHRFNLGASTDGGDLSRSGIQSPQAALGILALLLALTLVLAVALEPVVGARASSEARAGWERVSRFLGSVVLALLLVKLILEPDFLSFGAALAVVLGAVLAFGGFVLGQGALPGRAQGTLKPGSARAIALRRQHQERRRWLLLTLVALVVALAVVWQGSDTENVAAPSASTVVPLAPGSSPSTVAGGAGTSVTGAESTVPTEPGASDTSVAASPGDPVPSGENATRVEPGVTETGEAITATASGARPGALFVLVLGRNQDDCGGGPLRLAGGTRSADDGTIGPVSAIIPINTSVGRYYACFAEVDDATSTTPVTELVVT
ncbi:MAG: hypothetical protein ABR540_19070 [Acidimicrobiales bacterium]